MKKIIFAAMVISTTTHAAVCDIQEVTDPRVAGRAESIVVPGGKKLTIVGFQHGDRDFHKSLESLLQDANTGLANNQFTQRLHQMLLANNKDLGIKDKTIVAAQKNLAYLRDQLKSDSPPQFVADEGLMEDSEAMQKLMPSLAGRLYSRVWQRNLPPSSDYANSLLVLGGAENYLHMTEPALFKSTPIVGLESAKAENLEESTWNQYEAQKAKLWESAKSDPKFLEMMSQTIDAIGKYITHPYEPSRDDQAILSAISKNLPKQHYDLAMQVVKALLTTMKATLERDKATAMAMTSTGQSGVLFIGQLHLPSVARYLKQYCQHPANPTYTVPLPDAAR